MSVLNPLTALSCSTTTHGPSTPRPIDETSLKLKTGMATGVSAGVKADGVYVCVTRFFCRDLHEVSSKDINNLAAPVSRVGQRAVFEETLPALACLEELGKEDELALAGDRSLRVKLRIETTSWRIYRPMWSGLRGGGKTFTLWVS